MTAPTRPAHDDEVHIEGRVHLGELLRLIESEPVDCAFENEVDYVRDSVMPPHKRSQLRRVSANRSQREEFGFRLEPSGEHLYLENDGLALQFGILGGPGSGKTNLLTYLIGQIAAHAADRRDRRRFRPERQFGGIILDPKSALIEDVRRAFEDAGRSDDLVVVNSRELNRLGGINVIDCMLGPRDLGKVLVLAAQSSGIGARDPYWFQQMSSAFGAILLLLNRLPPGARPTLNELITKAIGTEPGNAGRRELALNLLIVEASKLLGPEAQEPIAELNDARISLENLSRHNAADPKNKTTVEQFMDQALGLFRESAYQCYSTPATSGSRNLYDRVIDEGKVLLVSPGPQELNLASILPSLIKLIFQRTVLSRFDRYRNHDLHNRVRPLVFLADEYHTVATQIEGERFGDSEYFSMARAPGGLCVVATQTVEQLKTSGLKDTWKAVFGTLAAVIGMKQEDPETIEYLQKRAGKKEVLQSTQGYSIVKGEVTVTVNTQRMEVPRIPEGALRTLRQGDAVVIGTTTDHKTPASIRFIRAPYKWAPPPGSRDVSEGEG